MHLLLYSMLTVQNSNLMLVPLTRSQQSKTFYKMKICFSDSMSSDGSHLMTSIKGKVKWRTSLQHLYRHEDEVHLIGYSDKKQHSLWSRRRSNWRQSPPHLMTEPDETDYQPRRYTISQMEMTISIWRSEQTRMTPKCQSSSEAPSQNRRYIKSTWKSVSREESTSIN